ncbi:MAG: tetratricopeptide repeat protein [Ignavibacteriaceae bacterium]|nr:tetratricopeptide repeat protein [Ignavibacteriaceae bacterium]HRN25991.1 tetratricopeptide repeat protein [Ignavibacteriaceae bacterium]HRP91365.1 tetratricopeptide repeat protein [Ignavibacteriaceae bacterium]HRQ53611.1 tetratricopeptide repeat protein [Ignavibacteriaceae bacterium]
MKRIQQLTFIVLLTALGFSFSFAQSVDELLKQGDQYVAEFNHQKALDVYTQADKLSPNNWDVLWRISRAYVDLGENMPAKTDAQKDEQEKTYKKALEFADKSVKLGSDKSITYVRRAIANGRIALFEGVFSAIGTVKDVKEDCEKAIQLGNGDNYVQALAHYVLGRTHLKVCEKAYLVRLPLGLGWGDTEKAVQLLETAVKLKPNFRMFLFELAKAYVEEDEYDKAKETLKKVEKAPKVDEDDDIVLANAKKLYEEIKNE